MEYLYWALALLAIILGLYYIGTRNYNFFADRKIPFFTPVPFLGNMLPVMMGKQNFADRVQNVYNKYKDTHALIGLYEFTNPVIILCDPEIIRLIGVKDSDYFIDHRSPISEDVDPLVGKTLMSLRGQRWKHMRSTLTPAFTSSKIKAMFSSVSQCGEHVADYLANRCEAEGGGVLSLEMKDLFTRYASDVIATAAFGVHVDSLEDPTNEFYEMGKEAFKMDWKQMLRFLALVNAPTITKMLNFTFLSAKANAFFRSLVHDTISAREKKHIIRPDMIQLLMQARKGTLHHDVTDDEEQSEVKDKTTAYDLDNDDITAQVLQFFMGGFDSSSSLLCFMSHLLAVNPEVQDKLLQEINSVLEEERGELTYDGLLSMKYLDMVISETLRLYPAAPFTDRVCVKPYVIAETDKSPSVKMNKGNSVWFPIYPIQRDPQYFEDPDKFDPERFSEENKHKIQPFTYIPFGVGPRNCIGIRFALMEAKIGMVCILRRFSFEVVAKTNVPLELDKNQFNMAAKGGFWVGIKPRTATTTH